MEFEFDVFLSHSSKDKTRVRVVAERLRMDGLKVWFDEWVIKAGDSIPAKVEEGLEQSRVMVLCMSANAFGSDWAQLESGTFRFRDPLNKKRRFIPLRLDDAPIKGSLAQFHYVNWLPPEREQEYAKLFEACRHSSNSPITKAPTEIIPEAPETPNREALSAADDYVRRRRDAIEQAFAAFEVIHTYFFKVCIDYLSLVDVLQAGLVATDDVRTRYYDYIQEIGQKLHEMHILEGRLNVAGIEPAARLMQQYRLQATEVNDMLRLQQPTMLKSQVNEVTEELFRRKDLLYEELANALRMGDSEEVMMLEGNATHLKPLPIGETWAGLRGVLQAYSTQIIKVIIGKAGLPITRIQYAGTYKGPVLDEADKLVSSMDHQVRNRFAVGCIQEVLAFERARNATLAARGVETESHIVRDLRQVLARFGHDLSNFESA